MECLYGIELRDSMYSVCVCVCARLYRLTIGSKVVSVGAGEDVNCVCVSPARRFSQKEGGGDCVVHRCGRWDETPGEKGRRASSSVNRRAGALRPTTTNNVPRAFYLYYRKIIPPFVGRLRHVSFALLDLF